MAQPVEGRRAAPMDRQVFGLWLINKAGGLVYHKNFSENHTNLTSNEYLVLAGTLHGIHAITSRLNPVPGKKGTGLETIEADSFKMTVLLTATGTKFVLITSPLHPSPHAFLQKVYDVYSDQVMKNPFHTPEMPIRVEGFDKAVEALVGSGAAAGAVGP